MIMIRLFKSVDICYFLYFINAWKFYLNMYIYNYEKIKAENLCIYVAD